jgi:hypothetical protein
MSEATTFEAAKLCPKCGKPGEETMARPVPNMPRGTRVVTVYCRTVLCPWENTPWMVQVNPDGSIPAPKDHTKTPKHYVGFEGHDGLAEQIKDALERDVEAQLRGGEIRRRG